MAKVNSNRVFKRNEHDPNPDGDFVVYWMQSAHRFKYCQALEYAVEWANELDKPLVIFEELKCDYPWASDRIHTFYLQGMVENGAVARKKGVNYVPVVERNPGQSEKFWKKFFKKACCLITDEFPVYFIRDRNEALGEQFDFMVATVDSNGIIPLGLTEKAPYNAYFFRKIMQRNFVEYYTDPPHEDPVSKLKNKSIIELTQRREEIREISLKRMNNPSEFISKLDIRHDVGPIELEGSRKFALSKLGSFIQHGLTKYDDKRNDPDEHATSGMSPWLHFGKVSEYEIVKTVFEQQPKNWDLDNITFNKGSTGGFFNGNKNVDSFLDEVITWREVGFHYAYHEPEYDQFETLPDWARKTLNKHQEDEREWEYSLEELAQSKTHDEIWNAAQTQLRREGIMHNYLRMLWGKKVIEWTPDPEIALAYLIELNNLYAIDGRDPNSYSGIFWCFGRFDRAWQERKIFGKVRYMTSDSTRKKVKLKEYLKKYAPADQKEE